MIYILITSNYYPQRAAFACLSELQRTFVAKVGGQEAAEAKDKAYNRSCASLFETICAKYNNLAEIDKLAAVTKKVDTIKVVMQENVNVALANCVKLEAIEQATGTTLSLPPSPPTLYLHILMLCTLILIFM